MARATPALLAICIIAACSEQAPELRSAGGVCASMDECASNLCYEATCMEIASDDDLDGLTNEVEIAILGTNPNSADSDNDGRTDGFEVGSDIDNPLDEDGDKIWDVHESASPESDQDGDCIPDQKDPYNLIQEADLEKAAQLACCCYSACSEAQMAAFESIQCVERDGVKQLSCLPAEMDTDGDGMGDSCDPCPLDYTNDSDGDGICDGVDNCVLIPDPENPETCGGCPAGKDDVDGDGLCGDEDPCPLRYDPDQVAGGPDEDGDGVPDLCDICQGPDQDTDNDGICDAEDLCPGFPSPINADADGDGLGDPCDSCHDPDGDALCGDDDPCPLVPGVTTSMDLDGDGIEEPCIKCTDVDNDGFGLQGEMCPEDNCLDLANPEQLDTDGDGQGDLCDLCTDPDGDELGGGSPIETCPVDNCPDTDNPDQVDTDGDGLGDLCDDCLDKDGDGTCVPNDCDDSSPDIAECQAGSHCHPDLLTCVACLEPSHCADDGDPCTLTRCSPSDNTCSHEQVDATSSEDDQALAADAGCTCPAVDPIPALSPAMATTFCGQVCVELVQCIEQDIHACHSSCIQELTQHGVQYATHACRQAVATVQGQSSAPTTPPFPASLCSTETLEALCQPSGCPLSTSPPCEAFCQAIDDCGPAFQSGLPAQSVTSLQRFARLAPHGLCSAACSGTSVGYPSVAAQAPIFTEAIQQNCEPSILATPSAGHPCIHYGPSRCRAMSLPWGGQEQGYLAVYRPQGVSWEEAHFIAQGLGGHLATLSSAGEDTFVFEHLAPMVWAPGSFEGPWLGGYRLANGDDAADQWVWVDDSPWSYTHWAPEQPTALSTKAGLRYRDGGPEEGDWGWLAQASDEMSWNTTGFIVEFPFPFSMPSCYDPDSDYLCGTPANGCTAPEMDTNGDGICDNDIDNCPEDHNASQLDLDRDGIGDICDDCLDNDGDGVCYEADCNDNSSIVGACGPSMVCDATIGTCVACQGDECPECDPDDPDSEPCPPPNPGQ